MYNGLRGLYQTGARFSLAGVADDPNDPANTGNFDWNALVQTVLNDVTQIIKPNSPQLRPVYTPTTTAAVSVFNNPVVLLGGAALLYLAFRRR